jgi:hypothetical protein
MSFPSMQKAISVINTQGVLLVFPVNNKKEPKSLWSEFFPRTKMVWEWDEDGDERVSKMWMLMKKLSDCRDVVYSKWFQGRATFFSRELFTAMLALRMPLLDDTKELSRTARQLLEALEQDSPLSTKELKLQTELRGKENESAYNRALKELFQQLLVVGFGEVDDGAFPSLAIGSTRVLYEDLWESAKTLSIAEAESAIARWMPESSPFERAWRKSLQPTDLTTRCKRTAQV